MIALRSDAPNGDDESQPQPLGEHQARAARGAVWTLVNLTVSIPFNLLVSLVVSRALGPVGYGQMAIYVLAIGIATQLAHAGYGSAAIRWGAQAWAGKRLEAFRDTLSKSLGWHVLVQAPLMCATAIALSGFSSLALIPALVVGVAAPCLSSSAALQLTMKERTDQLAVASLAGSVFAGVASMTAAVITQRPEVTWAATLLGSGLSTVFLFLPLDADERRLSLQLSRPRDHPPGFVRFAAFSGATAVLQVLVASRSEIFFLAAFAESSDVGQFALAFGIAGFIIAPINSIVGPLVPTVIAIVENSPVRADEAFARALSISSSMCALMVALVAAPVGIALPLLYGAAFDEAGHLVVPLVICAAIAATSNTALVFLNAHGVAGPVLVRSIVALAVNTVFALVFIPVWGLEGALVASVAGSLANSLPVIAFHKRRTDLGWCSIARCLAPLLMACVLAISSWLVVTIWEPTDRGATAPLVGACLLGTWVVFLRLSRIRLRPDDRQALMKHLPLSRLGALGAASRAVLGWLV